MLMQYYPYAWIVCTGRSREVTCRGVVWLIVSPT
ncbi:unnamed protein product [Brugia timori]|uniref:Uncharacterized protein n=1 Tax=Brugia timori TaxID=42155 RepID=A0A0R3R2U7_9BILA|nr:unnamed protein product [Brugia timori]